MYFHSFSPPRCESVHARFVANESYAHWNGREPFRRKVIEIVRSNLWQLNGLQRKFFEISAGALNGRCGR